MKNLRYFLIGLDMLLLLIIAGGTAEKYVLIFTMAQVNQQLPAMNTINGDEGQGGSCGLDSCTEIPSGTETDLTSEAQIKDSSKDIKKVALTFDDGPNQNHTEELLDGLRERNVKATFFLLGERVERFPEIVKKTYDDGHLIGCHGYEHVDLNKLSEEDAFAQVEKTNDLIYQATGEYPEYIRPPFGSWKKDLDAQASMIEVLWDIDTMDWSCKNEQMIINSITGEVKDGDIILMHDAYDASVCAALTVIDVLKSQGYEFVTVDELIFD